MMLTIHLLELGCKVGGVLLLPPLCVCMGMSWGDRYLNCFYISLIIFWSQILSVSFCSCVQNGYRLSQLVRPLFCITELADTIYCMCPTCISLILHICTSVRVEYWNMLHLENTFVNSKEYIAKHKDDHLW